VTSSAAHTIERFKVQFYTERDDGTKVYCICDFSQEASTALSPIVQNIKCGNLLFENELAARMFARSLNEGEIHFMTVAEGRLVRAFVDAEGAKS
jgi:hypothetical protein